MTSTTAERHHRTRTVRCSSFLGVRRRTMRFSLKTSLKSTYSRPIRYSH